jgi:tetratricopeptide (TPR) repeat protein
MESHAQLDPPGSATARQLKIVFRLLLILYGCPFAAFPQSVSSGVAEVSRIKEMYDEGSWNDVVRAVPEPGNENADLQMYRGLALGKLERWTDARQAFEAGAAGHPLDPRFPEELGGIAYRQSNFSLAKRELHRALRIQPHDEYANNFVASIYFLDGNLEAALKYWNRAGQPKLTDLAFEPKPRLNPLVLDRTFQFSPGSVWFSDRFLSSQARLNALGLYSGLFFDLKARPDSTYDLTIRAAEKNGWGSTKLEGAISLLRGLAYLTIFPEFYNIGQSGLNWRSLLRWDDQKRRFYSELSAPLASRPDIRYRIYFDGRNENWDLANTLSPFMPVPSGLNVEKAAAGAGIQFIPSGRWNWSTAVEYSHRTFRNLVSIPAQVSPFFTNGSSLALRAAVERSLIRFPERRFTLSSDASGEFGAFFQNPLGRYGRVEGSLTGHWFPQARGDDYELQTIVKGGETFGLVPFDELFTLGFERDNDLLLRGHPGLVNGEKGNAPLGRNFVLVNSEVDKIVFNNGLLAVRLGPLLDTGRIYDPSGYFGTRNWLWDTGIQTKLRILGSVEFVLGYGKDLRSGNNSFFTKVSR